MPRIQVVDPTIRPYDDIRQEKCLPLQIQWLLQIRQLQIRALIALFVPKNTTITPNKGTFCMPYLEFLPYLTFFSEIFGVGLFGVIAGPGSVLN